MGSMTTLTFDTLKYANRLKAAGAEPRIAEEQAQALAEVLEDERKDLTTSNDLTVLKHEIKHEIHVVKRDLEDLRREMQASFLSLEQRMTIKLGALMVVAVGSVAALVKLL